LDLEKLSISVVGQRVTTCINHQSRTKKQKGKERKNGGFLAREGKRGVEKKKGTISPLKNPTQRQKVLETGKEQS